jgi:Cobalamin biosynthesis protein CobT (nicotinate-mononucleotide:5, 6-dimethylbenzimidazole phosphoribosyltransferase)
MTSSKVAVSFGEGKHSDSVYVEAKQEYTIRLITLMEKQFYRIFEQEYDRAFAEIQTEDEILERFQDRLMKISEWNQIYVDDLYERFLREENCKDWFDQLIGAVFVANIRVMASIRTRAPKETLQIDIPRGNYFFHHSLIQVARNMYYKPYLFYQMRNDDDMMSDKTTEIFKIIYQGIESSIRILLPVNSLMNSYLPLYGGEQVDAEEQNQKQEDEEKQEENQEEEESQQEEEKQEEEEEENQEEEENHEEGESPYDLPSVSLDTENDGDD